MHTAVWFAKVVEENNELQSVNDQQQVATDVPLQSIWIQYYKYLLSYVHKVLFTKPKLQWGLSLRDSFFVLRRMSLWWIELEEFALLCIDEKPPLWLISLFDLKSKEMKNDFEWFFSERLTTTSKSKFSERLHSFFPPFLFEECAEQQRAIPCITNWPNTVQIQ